MATDSAEILRFVAVRDPQRSTKASWPRIKGYVPQAPAPTAFEVTDVSNAPAVIRAVDKYLLERGEPDPIELDDVVVTAWLTQHEGPSEGPAGETAVATLGWVVTHPDFEAERNKCARSFALSLTADGVTAGIRAELLRILKLYALLGALAQPGERSPEWIQQAAQNALVLITPSAPVRSTQPLEAPEPHRLPDPDALLRAATERAAAIEAAADDIAKQVAPGDAPASIDNIDRGGLAFTLTPGRLSALKPETRAILEDLGEDRKRSIPDLVEEMRGQAADEFASAVLPSLEEAKRIKSAALASELQRLMGGASSETSPLPMKQRPILVQPPRIGDLEIVRETFVCYEKGEIAHIENVLPKETRRRRHRVVDVAQSEEVVVDEREEEEVKENATTTRSELANELSRTASSQESLTAGGTINARYGPYVDVSANVGYAKSSSKEESTSQSRSYAQEITERAATKIRNRVLTTRRSLVQREVTEDNLHSFDNDTEKPIVGLYRWLNKRYTAEVVNVGMRVLLDVVIPDPAVFYRYGAAQGAGIDVGADPPPPFIFPGNNESLSPHHITPATWKGLAARFRANLEPPPPDFSTAASTLQSQQAAPFGADAGVATVTFPVHSAVSDKLAVPNGYQPLVWIAAILGEAQGVLKFDATGQSLTVSVTSPIKGVIAVGPSHRSFTLNEIASAWFAESSVPTGGLPTLSPNEEGDLTLPIAISALAPVVLSATVTVICRRTQAHFDSWQGRAYELLRQAHSAWDGQFKAAVRASEIGRGVAIQGNNPLENQKIIQTELKRMTMTLLGRNPPPITVSPGSAPANVAPAVDVGQMAATGPDILFWEQAFEWENLSTVFYPYYWTGRADEGTQSRLVDPDPKFSDFLRAGAARVIVPIRPGFEEPACLRLALDLPDGWVSSPAPTPESEPWLSIAEELRNRKTGGTGISSGTSWPVTLPTTLVMLDDAEDLFQVPPREEAGPQSEDDRSRNAPTDNTARDIGAQRR